MTLLSSQRLLLGTVSSIWVLCSSIKVLQKYCLLGTSIVWQHTLLKWLSSIFDSNTWSNFIILIASLGSHPKIITVWQLTLTLDDWTLVKIVGSYSKAVSCTRHVNWDFYVCEAKVSLMVETLLDLQQFLASLSTLLDLILWFSCNDPSNTSASNRFIQLSGWMYGWQAILLKKCFTSTLWTHNHSASGVWVEILCSAWKPFLFHLDKCICVFMHIICLSECFLAILIPEHFLAFLLCFSAKLICWSVITLLLWKRVENKSLVKW